MKMGSGQRGFQTTFCYNRAILEKKVTMQSGFQKFYWFLQQTIFFSAQGKP